MAASLKLLPGSTVRWRGRRYLIVDYESLDAIIARQPGKRRLERIPVNEAAPDHASHPNLIFGELRQTNIDLGLAGNARIVANAADPFDTSEQIVIRERINCVNSLAHWQIITESESIKEPRGRSRSQSYSQIALLHSHLFLHDQLTFADISGTDKFLAWSERAGYQNLEDIEPITVAAYIETLQRQAAPPTVKQHMAAIRMMFSWFTEKGVLAMNPAREVKTERFSRTEGKTPAFVEGEVQTLLDAIETSTNTGLRDRALLGILAYTFARIGAVMNLKVEDYYPLDFSFNS